MFRRWWNYIKTWFGMRSKQAMDPEVEIEAAINEARQQDKVLRNEAAKVIAHRTRVGDEVEEAAKQVAEAKELAKQALLKADQANQAGNAAEAERWTTAAQTIALRLQASQRNVDALQQQLVLADQQSQQAQSAVRNNAMRLEEVAAKRMQMLGQLQAAKMQETVNKAMASISAKVGGDAPSLDEIEDKIQDRMANAAAEAQLASDSPEGAMAELQQSVDLSSANSTLDDLRAELGLGSETPEVPPAVPEPTPPSALDEAASPPPTAPSKRDSDGSTVPSAPTAEVAHGAASVSQPGTGSAEPSQAPPPPPAPAQFPPSGNNGAPT
jgi:phage shock protein A